MKILQKMIVSVEGDNISEVFSQNGQNQCKWIQVK